MSPLLTFKTLISTSLFHRFFWRCFHVSPLAQFVYKYSCISSCEFIVKIILGFERNSKMQERKAQAKFCECSHVNDFIPINRQLNKTWLI